MSFIARISFVLLLCGCAEQDTRPCLEWRSRYVTEVKRVAGYEIGYQREEWFCVERAE